MILSNAKDDEVGGRCKNEVAKPVCCISHFLQLLQPVGKKIKIKIKKVREEAKWNLYVCGKIDEIKGGM